MAYCSQECRSCYKTAAKHCSNGQCGLCCDGDGCRRHRSSAAEEKMEELRYHPEECRSCYETAAQFCSNGQCGSCCSGDDCRRHRSSAADKEMRRLRKQRDAALDYLAMKVKKDAEEQAKRESSLFYRLGFGR